MKSVSSSLKRGVLVGVLCASVALTLASAPAKADDVADLKVLVVSMGLDSGFLLVRDMLRTIGVPFDVLDATTEDLTPARLSDGGTHGFYNGIILTDTELQPHFTRAEWDTLRAYEVRFRVREAVLSGFPAINPGLGLDYGMDGASIGGVSSLAGRWVAPAGGKERFEFVTTGGNLPITDFAWCATPRTVFGGAPLPGDTGPTVQALLIDAANPGCTLVSILRYPDGREVMLSTIANAWFLIHSQVLGYEFINFATKGVFLGARFVYLSAHADDLFYANDIWDPVANSTPLDGTNVYRMSDADFTNAKGAQQTLRSSHPRANTFRLDFPFNGDGAAGVQLNPPELPEPLTTAVFLDMNGATATNAFRYLNHTYTHRDMDLGESPSVTATEAQGEIQKNRQVSNNLGLTSNARTLISGEHSGLRNANGTESDPSDDVPYPWGKNDVFLNAANTISKSILYLASDSSQINQNVEAYVPSTPPAGIPSVFDPFDPSLSYYGFALLPRFPTNVFYNVTTPADLTDEYNYIFHERHVNQGQDPCEIPGAICQPRTYQEILAAEADTALRHILSFKRWPHFFHQSNLRNYDGSGKTLQFDWLNAIIARYEQLLKLPLKNLAYNQIGVETVDRLKASKLNISGAWNLTTNTVLLTGSASSATPSANVKLTGLRVPAGTTLPGSSTSIYGGQRHTTVPVGPSSTITLAIDQALTQ